MMGNSIECHVANRISTCYAVDEILITILESVSIIVKRGLRETGM